MINFKQVTSVALASRLFVIFLQFFSNIVIPDHNANVFQYLRSNIKNDWIPWHLNFVLSGFVRWDAEYFMHIAKYGYTFENSLAFFPLYPILIRVVTKIFTFCLPICDLDTALLMVFILSNIVFFVLTVRVLFKLSLLLFNEVVAYRTAILFCFNPASIFFTAPYTESLFCYLTFESIYCSISLLQKYSKPNNSFSLKDVKILVFIGLGTLTRSNGLLNIGFLVYPIICIFVTYFPKDNTLKVKHSAQYFCVLFLSGVVCSFPFILYQIYCFKKFCTTYKADLPIEIIKFASENGFVLPGQFANFNQSWCHKKFPLAYSYVQDHYWNVGFLRYYEFKQIPNFLLAAPCLYIIVKNCIVHLKINFKKCLYIFNLSELAPLPAKNRSSEKQFFHLNLSVFVVHALFLSIFCIFCVHIQVSTRMICSATPLFYWYCAYYYMNNNNTLLKLYFGSYVIVGTVMFSNFLPWT